MKTTVDIIKALNKSTLDLIQISDESDLSLIRNFTNNCVKIFEADFGYAFRKFSYYDDYKIVHKSPRAPNETILDEHKNKQLLIPINYGDHAYGNIVLYFHRPFKLNADVQTLADNAGNILAQILTVYWVIENEKIALALAEKQRETQVLLDQEKLKTDFIANATHELRTPLAIMKGNIDLALMGKDDKTLTRESLLAISEEINILAEILQDLALLTSKNGTGKQLVNPKSVDLGYLLEQISKRLQAVAKDKNIKITVKTTEGKVHIFGNQGHLEKLFLNLIKNAVTYGKQNGKININIEKNKHQVKVDVVDDGIGISKEDQPNIFERFYQGDKAHSSHGAHSGLGLAIAKWAADTHGGNIKVKSTLGVGSTFTVTLPLAKSKAKHPKARQS